MTANTIFIIMVLLVFLLMPLGIGTLMIDSFCKELAARPKKMTATPCSTALHAGHILPMSSRRQKIAITIQK